MVPNLKRKGNRKFFDKKFIFRAVGISFLLAIVFLSFEDFKLYQRKQKLAAQISSYQKQIQEIEKSSQTLKEEIANADNPDYLEKIAYEQLGQQKPGEKQIIFIAPQEKSEQSAVQQNILDTKSWAGWLSGAWQWIKNKF
jgi:cell division protein FtsB